MAFGKERYAQETQAFKVTDRYTGQKLDEDTGLYFYGSRYYDPELARFIQADTVVPSATTSQALNRYAYVKNNPLKFTDPTGHCWFKKWIGTIVSIALMFIPGVNILAMSFWQFVFTSTVFSAIGSAVSTIVNGGTFASFAIGVGIGFAASVAAAGIGSAIGGGGTTGAENLANFLKQGPIEMAAYGALQGSIAGAITSAVYGQNIGKGIGEGALGGVAGAGIGYGASVTLPYLASAVSFGLTVVKELAVFVTTIPPGKWAIDTIKFGGLIVEMLTAKWEKVNNSTFKLPPSIKKLYDITAAYCGQTRSMADQTNANGCHSWHAALISAISNEYGPLGAALSWLSGVGHETIDPVAMSGEIKNQGIVNTTIDSAGDIVSNTVGAITGLCTVDLLGAISTSYTLGKFIPGPADPWQGFEVYSGNPTKAWEIRSKVLNH